MIYIGEAAYPGQPTAELETRPNAYTDAEGKWLSGVWFITKLGNYRRDVCVAGHYLRLILRARSYTSVSEWSAAVMPLEHPQDHLSKADHGVPVVTSAPSAAHAALAFYRLFLPGEAE